MTGSADPEARLVRFLLGSLPEAEHEEVEARLFTDEQLQAEVECATDDLIHAYLGEGLTPEQRAQFETHFLASGRHRARLALIRDLTVAIRRERPAESVPALRASPVWRWVVAAAVVVGAAAVIFLLASRTNEGGARQASARPTPTAEPHPPDIDPVRRVRLPAAPGREAITIVLPATARTVRMEIKVADEGPPSYDATLRDATGREVWRAEGLVPDDPAAPLVVSVPADVLAVAEYDLSIEGEVLRESGPSPAGPLRYRLRIARDPR